MKQSKHTEKKPINYYIKAIIIIFGLLFLLVAGYLIYFAVKEAPDLVDSPYNGRLDKLNESCSRGDILAADGKVLATTEKDENGKEVRSYPYGRLFSHVVGYTSVGESGLESKGFYLLNSHVPMLKQIYTELTEDKNIGDSMVTTLDVDLQALIYDAMGDYRGACVVLNPETGDVLAMVSKPDFNPNTLKEDYESIVGDSSNTNLLNRVTHGLYSPGSTFKIVTALAALEQDSSVLHDFSYDCQGAITLGQDTVRCSHGNSHGYVDLADAFNKSCNGAFITLGMSLDLAKFRETAEKLMFNQKVNTDFSLASSDFVLDEDSKKWQVMHTSFGQGDTLVTPLENAMIVAAVANKGEMMKPRVIKQIVAVDGTMVENRHPESLGQVISEENASILSDMMVGVVNNGTANVLASSDYQAAAKTGSAQTDSEKETNAWLVAFAPADHPKYVVSIVLEEAGSGSNACGPIVKKIFDACLAN